jgi:hypothetical protein
LVGPSHGTLTLGLPLLLVLSPAQLRAVVAHELGHSSGNHGRFSGWIYRLSRVWSRLIAPDSEGRRAASPLLDGFFHRFAPFFAAYTFVLQRENEYAADRCSVEITSARDAAEALVRVRVAGAYLDNDSWLLEDAAAERDVVTRKDSFVPHELSREEADEIRGQLAQVKEVQAAYLVRKTVRHLPERPLLVLGVVPKKKLLQTDPERDRDRLRAEVWDAVSAPHDLWILVLSGDDAWARKPLEAVPGAEICRKPR